jgi:hypothetical protein
MKNHDPLVDSLNLESPKLSVDAKSPEAIETNCTAPLATGVRRRTMKYHLTTITCLLLAMACYGFFALGGAAIVFLVAGVAMEVFVYIRLFRRSKARSS